MTDPWDAMITGTDDEVAAEIRSDAIAYARHFVAGNLEACVDIQRKYFLHGLSPQEVSEAMIEMSGPEGGGA